ncbi:MAG: acyl-ACP--UDP-N-acetylglucosamine O-acyltransferase [Planctomycetes bacterium]|nr:acyl-ACP--UDP-N-acetylglucosamine O-acyltransferase [Planctomycetota bacterium]
MATEVHSTAVVHPDAQLGVDVTIGPYSVVGARVRIGDRTRLGPHVVVDGVTSLGSDNFVVGQANLGGPPQDLSYKNEPTQLEIGDRNTIREFVTINRGTVKGGGITRIASDCLFMACSHVAHDCEVRERVIMANCVLLAGHCYVGEGANISGAAAAHHFVTIGAYAYIGGMTRINQDVPPFMLLEGHPARVRGVNEIGLQRAGFALADIERLWTAFRSLYRSGDPKRRTIDRLRADEANPQLVRDLLDNLERTEQGQKGRFRESLRAEFRKQGEARILGQGGA